MQGPAWCNSTKYKNGIKSSISFHFMIFVDSIHSGELFAGSKLRINRTCCQKLRNIVYVKSNIWRLVLQNLHIIRLHHIWCLMSVDYTYTLPGGITAVPICVSNNPTLQWLHNERDGVGNHKPHDCLLSRLFKVQIKESIKAPRHWPLQGEFTGDRWIPRTKVQ